MKLAVTLLTIASLATTISSLETFDPYQDDMSVCEENVRASHNRLPDEDAVHLIMKQSKGRQVIAGHKTEFKK